MNMIISAANVTQTEDKAASININNNKNNTTSAVVNNSFSGVVVSGADRESARMDSNTYESLLKETDSVKEQIQSSAANAKDNLKALVNRLSGADAVKIDEDGFNLNDATAQDCVNIVDRIKIELVSHSDKYVAIGTSISSEQLQQVTGSTAMANEISAKLKEANVPDTKENIDEVQIAVDKAESFKDMSENAKNYLVANNMEPTIDNVYKAQHMEQGTYAAANNVANKLSDREWQDLQSQVSKKIEEAGLEVNQKNLDNARTFVDNSIPVTSRNLIYKNELDNMNTGEIDDILSSIAANMAAGNSAGTTLVAGQTDVISQVADAINVVNTAGYNQVAQVTTSGVDYNIASLKGVVNANVDTKDVNVNSEVDDNYKLLCETRILMTADAGMFLARQGVNIMSVPIADMVDQLKTYDKATTLGQMEQMTGQLMGNVVGETTLEAIYESFYDTVYDTKSALAEIKNSPDVMIGQVVGELGNGTLAADVLTITAFAQKGSNLRQQYERAEQTYEAMGTQMRSDLGDSVAKAVKASTIDILNELGLDQSEANKDAVRILGYNSMEINKESIDNIKLVREQLKNLVNNMKPETVLKMIREGINPMNADISDLNNYLQVNANDNETQEKYSRFLYKLDRTKEITPEERTQFIGIYKMMNIFGKDAGVAAGALVNQGAALTMSNLCSAYESRKSYGMEAAIDDETDIASVSSRFYMNLFSNTSSSITPLSLKKTDDNKNIMEQTIEDFCNHVQDNYDSDAEAEYYGEYYEEYVEEVRSAADVEQSIIRDLKSLDYPVTINNAKTYESIMESGYYNKSFFKTKDDLDKVNDFIEKIGHKDELEDAFSELAENANNQLNETIAKSDDIDYDSLEELRMRNREIGMIAGMSARHDYKIPIVTDGGIATVNLTLVSDSEDNGRISISFATEELGNVSVEAKTDVTDDKLKVDIYAAIDSEDDNLIKEKLENVAKALKANNNAETVNINTIKENNVKRVTYDRAAESVATDQLYSMARTIITNFVGVQVTKAE